MLTYTSSRDRLQATRRPQNRDVLHKQAGHLAVEFIYHLLLHGNRAHIIRLGGGSRPARAASSCLVPDYTESPAALVTRTGGPPAPGAGVR